MNLENMTREQLWALDMQEIGRLANEHGLEYVAGLMPNEVRQSYISRLDRIRLELHQTAAEERQER